MEIDSFLVYLRSVKRYSEHTISAYREDLNQFFEFCEKVELIESCTEVTAKMVRRFEVALMSGKFEMNGQKLKPMVPKTVRRKLSSLKTFFRFQVKEGRMAVNPVDGVVAPENRKKIAGICSRFSDGRTVGSS